VVTLPIDPTLEFFGEALQKYHSEHKDALSVPDKRPIGFLLIDCKNFKETLIPNPLRCLTAVHDLMPVLAKRKMQSIIDETNDATFKLESDSTSTLEYVTLLTFLDEIQTRIEPVEEQEYGQTIFLFTKCYFFLIKIRIFDHNFLFLGENFLFFWRKFSFFLGENFLFFWQKKFFCIFWRKFSFFFTKFFVFFGENFHFF